MSGLARVAMKASATSVGGAICIRARAPLRIGLAGGGTDLSPFSERYGGAVLNCTLDRYAYAFLRERDDGKLVFEAKDLAKTEKFDVPADVSRSSLDLHRGVYQRMMKDYNNGKYIALDITTSVDAPLGSGLGSSSALVVALVSAFCDLLDLPFGQYEIAHLAWKIEREDLRLPGGKQDQYAAAFGGINFIEFLGYDRVIVNPLRVHPWIENELETSIVIAFTGQSRESTEIINSQKKAVVCEDINAMAALHQLKSDARQMKDSMLRGNIREMAEILDRSWLSKKATARSITNSRIETLYELARRRGAISGKVSGAGGGGFMMFFVRPEMRPEVSEALNNAGATVHSVKFTDRGCETWRYQN